MICDKCGNKIENGATFCTVCGNSLHSMEVTPNTFNQNGSISSINVSQEKTNGEKDQVDEIEMPAIKKEPIQEISTSGRMEIPLPPTPPQRKAKRKKVDFKVYIILGLLLILFLLLGYMYLSGKLTFSEEKSQQSESNTTTTVPFITKPSANYEDSFVAYQGYSLLIPADFTTTIEEKYITYKNEKIKQYITVQVYDTTFSAMLMKLDSLKINLSTLGYSVESDENLTYQDMRYLIVRFSNGESKFATIFAEIDDKYMLVSNLFLDSALESEYIKTIYTIAHHSKSSTNHFVGTLDTEILAIDTESLKNKPNFE